MASDVSKQVFIARDDFDGEGLSLGGGRWAFASADYYFNKIVIWPGFSQNISSPRGSFSYTFDGTEVRIFGYSAPAGNDQVFQVTLDNNAPYNSSTDDLHPETAIQWYQSPHLGDGQHTMKVDNMNGQSVDFMLVTPSPTTPLTGQILMVDDSYNGIKYSGGWQARKNFTFVQSSIFGGSSVLNTTHTTSNVGDTMTFPYTGANATVYGLFLQDQVGSLSYTYSIDGGSNFTKTLTASGTEPIKEQPHYQLLDTGPLAPGNHTLALTLTGCIGQTLVVDYILYTPAFDNLASMPNLTSSSPPSTTSTIGQTTTPTPSSGKSTNAGAIAGGVVGGIAALALVAVLLWWLRRRQAKSAPPPSDIEHPRPAPLFQSYNAVPVNDTQHNPYRIEPFSASSTSPDTPAPPAMSTKGGLVTYNPSSSSAYRSGFTSSILPDDSAMSTTSGPTSTHGGEDVEHLRQRVHQLTVENQHLANQAAPPAYS